MRRIAVLALGVLVTSHCSSRFGVIKPIDFLTREGCVQTEVMRQRLDEAVKALGKPIPYSVIDLDSLSATDARKGYPTPTILVGNADLFGMPAPTPPFPDPT